MRCYICEHYLSDDYIDLYRLRTCDYEFIICPYCENEIEQEKLK
jgi:uncharacterized CHY-type Zn-finger protein